MVIRITRSQRLMVAIATSSAFFLIEISVGFYTHSLALVADAFHYLNDLVGFIVALLALKVSKTEEYPQVLSFGWQRAQVLGAFFNGSLLLALGISIFLQSIERFVTLHRVENPKLMFIIGSIGLGFNIICATFLHEHNHHNHDHDHSQESGQGILYSMQVEGNISLANENNNCDEHHGHKHMNHEMKPVLSGHDLGMMGVLLHVLGDAANNLGVMVAALVIWLTRYEERYYADPGTSMGIAVMIMFSSLPLIRQSGIILLESTPDGVASVDVKHDLEKISGILAIHELHIWRLNQHKVLASVHIVISDQWVSSFPKLTRTIQECFHAYGIHSVTVQPEISSMGHGKGEIKELGLQGKYLELCQLKCSTVCKGLTCCG